MNFNLPAFFYVKAFWEALSLFIAGALALLVIFGKLTPEYALSAGAIYSWFLSLLSLFRVEPQVKALMAERALMAKKAK